ncbi:DMT family transporter [Actinoplanes friuliensis]|uniref:EamA domain-containing protein n=1 Tax=Actinoplanes friuliensis DSM 7358 TaxID=1246995 RepID=U5W514_9ACTN|nr:DMT family transporter [Actinoplanes friuliensis]AGZ43055.1 hypothetical protein AFR_23935 [Actinoplanes friuliensis DSM 7358]
MTRGITLGTGAGLLWGLAFVLPALAPGWSPVAITTGRYLAYGIVSVLVIALIARRRPGTLHTARRHWRHALLYAATGNVAYYLLLVVAIQTAGAPITTVLIGSIPVVMAAVANLREHRYRWRHLAGPLVLVSAGLAVVSGPGILHPAGGSAAEMAVGLAASTGAIVLWTSYGIGNATFLRRHPDLGGSLWAAVIGVATGGLALLLVPVALVTGPSTGAGGEVGDFLAASAALGIAVSWGATWLWNEASSRLSTTLAGLLITTETVAGYAYSYMLEARWPALLELLGFALVLVGVVAVTALRDHPGNAPKLPLEGSTSTDRPGQYGSPVGTPGGRSPDAGG